MNHTKRSLRTAFVCLSLVCFAAATCGAILFYPIWTKVVCGVLASFCASYATCVLLQNAQRARKTKTCIDLLKNAPEEIDKPDGISFVYLISCLFYLLGYKVKFVRQSENFDRDLVIRKDGVKTVVQAKRYNGKVSLKAVQQAIASETYHRAQKAIVVTNSYFTRPEITLADVNEVTLIDRDGLLNLIEEAKKRRQI